MSFGRREKWDPRMHVKFVNAFRPHGDPLKDQREAARKQGLRQARNTLAPPSQPPVTPPAMRLVKMSIPIRNQE